MKGKSNSRPSENRRKKLKATEANKFPHISNMIPIERYYDVADKLKQLFESNFTEHQLDNAYVYGIRCAKFSTEALPTHDYYNIKNPQMKAMRRKNQKDLKSVLDRLEEVVQHMDLEELEKAEIRRREEATMRKIREQEAMMKKEEEDRKAQKELMNRLNALDTMFPKPPTGVGESQTNATLPSYKKANDMKNQIQSSSHIDGDMPPPIPFSGNDAESALSSSSETGGGAATAPPPPSYDDLMKQHFKFANYEKDSIANLRPVGSTSSRDLMNDPMLQQQQQGLDFSNHNEPATLVNPLGPLLPASLGVHGKIKQSTFKVDVPIATMQYTSRNEYETLKKLQKVQVFQLRTHQGKYSAVGKDSTNGCTVISPLVAINHLTSENNGSAGISDVMIESIIDDVAPRILVKVRKKLGLAGQALIIPSDVHDFLVDENILKQEMFVGVFGGNLLDGDHMNGFLNLLERGEDTESEESNCSTKKVAAALFFHEHVVSILKVVLPDGSCWYDLVDSLPRQINDRLGGTRTRCKDIESLQAVLQWYACNKFSTADVKYIDTNQWDDVMCNFDPRVFQAFVWSEQ